MKPPLPITCTILATSRPDLLTRTIETSTPLISQCRVVGLNNGADPEITPILQPISDVYLETDRLGIGEAVSYLTTHLDTEYWLHLEDDWEMVGGWHHIEEAMDLLDYAPLVRLRSHADHVDAQERGIATRKHQVTGQVIKLQPLPPTHLIGQAHYTLNPSLIRTIDAELAWPAKSEAEAQRNWYRAGKKEVVQMLPGMFRHIGEGRSVR